MEENAQAAGPMSDAKRKETYVGQPGGDEHVSVTLDANPSVNDENEEVDMPEDQRPPRESIFFDLESYSGYKFRQSYQQSNFVSRFFYTYMFGTILDVINNNNKIKPEHFEDICFTRGGVKDVTKHNIERFNRFIEEGAKSAKERGKEPDFYWILLWSLFKLYFWDIVYTTCIFITSDIF